MNILNMSRCYARFFLRSIVHRRAGPDGVYLRKRRIFGYSRLLKVSVTKSAKTVSSEVCDEQKGSLFVETALITAVVSAGNSIDMCVDSDNGGRRKYHAILC